MKNPHRLSFLTDECSCDVCGKRTGPGANKHASKEIEVGWVSCGQTSCNSVIESWSDQATMSEEAVRERLGDPLQVLRSNHALESGWRVFGAAVFSGEDQTWLVKVRLPQKHLSKIVALEDLELWNN